jgi:hypothetical protein
MRAVSEYTSTGSVLHFGSATGKILTPSAYFV